MLSRMWPSTIETPTSQAQLSPLKDSSKPVYNTNVDDIRDFEYPTLADTTYLDHAGTTPYARSLIESWTTELTTHLFGNPHSASAASQLSTRRVDDIRLRVLKFFNASPDGFDIVFVANATAAIKLVAEAFRDNDAGFWFGYHADAHTSLVGCRELADQGSICFADDRGLETWVSSIKNQGSAPDVLRLVAYPGQSNMTGRKLPIRYCEQIRDQARITNRKIYTLLDVASLVSTSPLDLSDASSAPDFMALSFYKIFGFPDLGALIVRKESAGPLMAKCYFAGGTVDGVAVSGDDWHIKKPSIHSALEEGTLPFHNIIALDHAMNVHQRLFGSMETVSKHTRYLAREAYHFLKDARHATSTQACKVYGDWNEAENGPIVVFNLRDSSGNVISASEVEKLCIVKGIQLRTGGLCNPGGIARHLDLSREQFESNYLAGRRCGGESEVIDGKPTGVIRVSFGAMSTRADLHRFTNFIQEYFVERDVLRLPETHNSTTHESPFFVESLSVYPIKSCGAFNIPRDQRWKVTAKGLAWDREWCLVHEGTNVALSQKKYPRMTLLRPTLDLSRQKLIVSCDVDDSADCVEIDLDEASTIPTLMETCQQNTFKLQKSKVCGDTIPIQVYTSAKINGFFSRTLDVPCCLARYPRDTTHARNVSIRRPKGDVAVGPPLKQAQHQPQLMLSNESPILIVSSSSIDELNKHIRENAKQRESVYTPSTVSASTFRANIVVAQEDGMGVKSPYAEDNWTSLTITPRHRKINLPSSPYEQVYDVVSNASETRARHDDHSQTSMTSYKSTSESSGTSTTISTASQDSTVDTDNGDSTNASNNHHNPTNVTRPNSLPFSILGPCQRCQMLSVNQTTSLTQQEPFSTLVKTRRRGDGRVWFGVHAALESDGQGQDEERSVGVGDLIATR